MNLQNPTFIIAASVPYGADHATMPAVPGIIGLPPVALPITGTDSVHVESFDFAAEESRTITIDNFPLMEVDGQNRKNGNGRVITFTAIKLLIVRVEPLGGAMAGTVAVNATKVAALNLSNSGSTVAEAIPALATDSGSILELQCTDLANARITVMLVGTESDGGYYS